jgi:hypothetical protein
MCRPTSEPKTQKAGGWLIGAVGRFQRAFYSGEPGPGVARTTNSGGSCWEAGFGWLLERRGGYKRGASGVSFAAAVYPSWSFLRRWATGEGQSLKPPWPGGQLKIGPLEKKIVTMFCHSASATSKARRRVEEGRCGGRARTESSQRRQQRWLARRATEAADSSRRSHSLVLTVPQWPTALHKIQRVSRPISTENPSGGSLSFTLLCIRYEALSQEGLWLD